MHSTTVLIRSIKSKARMNEARPSPSNPRTQNSLQKTRSEADDAESERSAADADSTCTARRRRRAHNRRFPRALSDRRFEDLFFSLLLRGRSCVEQR